MKFQISSFKFQVAIVGVFIIALAIGAMFPLHVADAQFIDRIVRGCTGGVVTQASVIVNPNGNNNVNVTPCTGGSLTINGVPVTAGGLPDPGSNGIVVRTAAATDVARSIAGSGAVNVSNGNGVAGNPTLSLAGSITTSGLTTNTSRLLGRSTAATGAIEEITLGTGLAFTGTTLNVSGFVTSVSGTSPISSSGGTTPAISIANAAADGLTKGAASFTASDFDASAGNISIDYTNGQKATAAQPGFLAAADWSTFNSKQAAGSYITALTGDGTATGPGSAALTVMKVNGVSYSASPSSNTVPVVTSANTVTYEAVPNAALANSTISGVALGGTLFTLTINSPLTGTSYNGSAGVSIGCQVASGSQAGCLSSADWTTFNNKGPGSVTSVSVVTANGVSGSVANPTTTPAITLTLGAITPTTVTIAVGQTTSAQTDLFINPTTKASGNLFQASVNSASKFSVDFAGAVTTPGLSWTSAGATTILSTLVINGNSQAFATSGHLVNWNGGVYGWSSASSATAGSTFDTNISRNAAGIVQFGTTAANALGSWAALNGTLSGGLAVGSATPVSGMVITPQTITTGGTTGNQTINKMAGTVNIAATGTTVTVTNSLVSTSSQVFAVIRTNDSTATIKNVVPGSGSFVITLTAAATAEVSIGFVVFNQ